VNDLRVINNEILQVKISDIGGEPQSIIDLATGREYLFNGDEKWWSSRAPSLFPIVGRCKNDEYRYDKKVYAMPQHGFIRKNPMELCDMQNFSVTHKRSASKATMEIYPFDFDFFITHRLENRSLMISYKVVNKTNKIMPFSVGAHPAFASAIGDKIILKDSTDLCFKNIEDGLVLPQKHRIGNEIIIDENLFKNGVLIFEDNKLNSVSLSRENKAYVEVKFDKFPYFGIWSKPLAPFVCLEPWFGVADSVDTDGDINKKAGIQLLEANKTFIAEYEIIIK
jgi:galactose mutarotase-like enzyme